jgi:histidinol-phosphate aminotransferase
MSEPVDVAALVRPELRRLGAYRLDRSPCRHKLDQNEAPFEPPPALKRRVAAELAAAAWARYPDFHADALRRDLGEFHGWPADGVLVGNGSNELLDVTLSALVTPGGEVLGCEPSFGLYRMMVLKAGGVPRFLPPADDLRLPLAALLAEVERAPRRPLLLCSPNNPTGDALPPEAIESLLARLQGPLLLDNAYGEFSRYDYRPLLDRHPQLILLRTFSKAWALAGLRLGYLLAAPSLVEELLKVKLPYNLGHAAVLAGRAALAAAPAARRRVAVVVARRAQWQQMLAAAGLRVQPSEANFLLVRCASPAAAAALRDGLAARGIRVRDVGAYPGLAGALRIAAGSGAALRATRQALAELAGSGAQAAPVGVVEPARQTEPVELIPPAGLTPRPRSAAEVRESAPLAIGGRWAEVERVTGETQVRLALGLDGGPRRIAVGNGFFGHMLEALAKHGGLGLEVAAAGDLHVDLHHTVEDVGIACGQALAAALGARRGVVRFGAAYAPLDEALARAVVDLSGRGFFVYGVPPDLAAAWVTAEFPLTLVADFFQAFADRGRLTLHLEILAGRNGHHAAEAAFKAVALALRQAVALRPSAGAGGTGGSGADSGEVPSTKGTLTV